MSASNMSDNELLQRFSEGSVGHLTGNQLAELGEYLDNRAAETGLAAPVFISEALRAIDRLFREHDEYGGVRADFVNRLDGLVREHLCTTQRGDVLGSAKRARQFRDEVLKEVGSYDPRLEHAV